jgi:hypothetical protein
MGTRVSVLQGRLRRSPLLLYHHHSNAAMTPRGFICTGSLLKRLRWALGVGRWALLFALTVGEVIDSGGVLQNQRSGDAPGACPPFHPSCPASTAAAAAARARCQQPALRTGEHGGERGVKGAWARECVARVCCCFGAALALQRWPRPCCFFPAFPLFSFYELPLCVPTLMRGSGSYRGLLRTGVLFEGLCFALGPFVAHHKMPIGPMGP